MKDNWTVEVVNQAAADEITSLSQDLQTRFLHISELLISFGPQKVGLP
jgi:hypothetical protein